MTKLSLPRELHLSPDWHPVMPVMACPHYGCPYTRTYSTNTGHRMGLAGHMIAAHGVRVFFDRKEQTLSEYREQVRRMVMEMQAARGEGDL